MRPLTLRMLVVFFAVSGSQFAQSGTSMTDVGASHECPSGYVPLVIHMGFTVRMCVNPNSWEVVLPIAPPPEEFVEPPETHQTYYHASTCARNLDGLPIRIGIIRHDDVESYISRGLSKSQQSQSGFYATNMADAVVSALSYLIFGEIRYVAGEHRHSYTTTCDLPIVSKSRFDTIRSRAQSEVWYLYHLILQNCQSWASHVVGL